MEKFFFLLFAAFLATSSSLIAQGSKESDYIMSISGEMAKVPADYVPPFISNGTISTSIDNFGLQKQKTYEKIVPDVVWTGHRYSLPERQLFSFGHYDAEIFVDGKSVGAPLKWRQTLDTKRAFVETEVEYELANVKTTVFVSKNDDILAVRKTVLPKSSNAESASVKFTYTLNNQNSGRLQPKVFAETVAETSRCKIDYTAFGYQTYKGEISLRSSGNAVFSTLPNTMVAEKKLDLRNGEKSADFFVCFADNFPDFKFEGEYARFYKSIFKKYRTPNDNKPFDRGGIDVAKLSLQQKARAESGFDKIFVDHKTAWENLQTEFYVSVPSERIRQVYNTSLYFLRSLKTKWSLPICLYSNGNHWNGSYFTWDEAFMSLGLGAAGEFELSRLAPDFRLSIMPVARFRTDHPTGDYGLFYEFQTREDGTMGSPHPLGFWSKHIFHMSAIALECYSHYLFTNDKKYLEDIYPVIKGCAQYYYAWSIIKNEKGETVVCKTLDLERYGPACPNPFLTSCGIINNFDNVVAAAKILGLDFADVEKYAVAANELRKSLPNDGEKYVPSIDRKRKSIAAIGGLFPYPVFDETSSLQKNAAYDFAKNIGTVGNMYPVGNNVCTWYYAWASSALIRLGDREIPAKWLETTAHNTGYFGETWEINESEHRFRPWFSTAAANFLHSICTMLVSSRENGSVIVAPATPKEWRDFSFNLPAYGGNKVSANFQNGKLSSLDFSQLSSNSDPKRTILIPKIYVDNPPKNWDDAGDFWKIQTSGKFVWNKTDN